MNDVKICAQCGAPFVGTRCPNCGGVAESETEYQQEDCDTADCCCSNCGGTVGNGTSGRMISAPTPWKGILDVPKCPWCGELMAVELRQNLEGKWISYCHCVICKAKGPTVTAEINKTDLIEMAKMVVNCRFQNTGNPFTNGDEIRKIGSMADPELAELLRKVMYEGIEDQIPFCKNDPECEKLVNEWKGIPEKMCKECLIRWLGTAKEHEIATSATPPRNDKEEGEVW